MSAALTWAATFIPGIVRLSVVKRKMPPRPDWPLSADRIRRALGVGTSRLLSIPPIIVNSPSYSETSGGTIVMHYLVDRLRNLGFRAYVFPWVVEREHVDALDRGEEFFAADAARHLANYRLNPDFNASLASFADLKRCIAVYPLRVKGNPLRAECVVRWHINRKSLLPDTAFSDAETDFYYGADFHEGPGPLRRSRMLRLTYAFLDDYREDPGAERDVDCYMIRKGTSYSEEAMKSIPEGAIQVDGLGHAEMAKVFKRSRVFYSFDLYTAYEYYAAVCGCIPVVVPRSGMAKTEWRRNEADRYGVAYGIEDIDWAIRTREVMLAEYARSRRREQATVRNLTRFVIARYSVGKMSIGRSLS
jgi:hypothetical protein